MKKSHSKLITALAAALCLIFAGDAAAQKQLDYQTQINPAALGQIKKSSPKKPVAFAFDETIKVPSARLADESIVRLLPQEDITAMRQNLKKMLAFSEQKEIRQSYPLTIRADRPAVFANLSEQTPTRSQGNRGTCGVFAAVAALEAGYKRQYGRDYDFSEQHVNWLKNVSWMADADDAGHLSQRYASVRENLPGSLSAGVSCVGILQILTRLSTVEESLEPYIANGAYEDFAVSPVYAGTDLRNFRWWDANFQQKSINEWNFAAPQMPADVRLEPKYGASRVVALTEDEMRRTEVIESILADRKEVVFAMNLFNATAETNRGDPVWRHLPGATPGGGHCMTIVGYDRNRRFFIVKNSWGPFNYDAASLDPQWRDVARLYNNYVLLDYDYFTSDVVEAGYIQSVKPSAINFEQKMLGLWDVAIKQKSTNRTILSGTLAWRQNAAYLRDNGASHVQLARKSFRIGDFTDTNNRSYRVNGELVNARKVNLYIDFNRPNMPYYDRDGVKIEAVWAGREVGRQTFSGGAMTGIPNLAGVPLSDLEFSAAQR